MKAAYDRLSHHIQQFLLFFPIFLPGLDGFESALAVPLGIEPRLPAGQAPQQRCHLGTEFRGPFSKKSPF